MSQGRRHAPCAIAIPPHPTHRPTECAGYMRRGKSLIELLVVLTLVSGALGLCALTLTALFRTETQLRRDREQQIVADRLADLWRADAHGATACDIGAEAVFTYAAGRRIRYSIETPRIWREVHRGDAVQHRDSFPLPALAEASFATRDEAGRTFAVLSIQAQPVDRANAVPVRAATFVGLLNLHNHPQPVEAQP